MTPAMRTLLPVGCFAIAGAMTLAIIMGARAPIGVGPQLVNRGAEAFAEASDAGIRRSVDARFPPYSAVGRFEGTMLCTAAIVLHPRIIITAGHCIADRDGTIKRSNLSFRPGYQAGTDLGRFKAKVWAVGSKQRFERQSVHDASQDWVILVLDETSKGVEPFPLSHHSFKTLKSHERKFLMPSYSNDIGDAEVLSVDPKCSIRDLVWDVLVHDCRAQYGSSGAPLLMRDRLGYAVIGIHTGSMFASDDGGHVAKFVGNRAIGSWMFTEALLALSRQLNGEVSHNLDSPTY
ncbi:MAG: trypsin-like serine protease [Xanthobacteraceae bacterium]|nr:trypsin-like serine protease [Xanthobacteraceae bacterium]